MEELPITLHGARALVIGAGRLGKVLCQQLRGLGATVTLAAKAHLRNGRPLILAISTNDALAGAARNLGTLLDKKHVYFVPFRQDDPTGKPTSLVADFSLVADTVSAALEGNQLQPMVLGPKA